MDQEEIEIFVESRPAYLHVRARGVRSGLSVAALTQKVYTAAVEAQKSKVLVDVMALEGGLSPYESLKLIQEEFVKIRLKRVKKAAIVDLGTVQRWFLETAAQNRGFNLRVFDEENKARQWLLNH